MGYATAAPAYTPGVYAGANQAFPSGERSRLSHIITEKQTSNRVIFLPKTKSKSSSMKRLFLKRFFPSTSLMEKNVFIFLIVER